MLESELKDPLEQFPLLPPPEDRDWPDPRKREMTNESIDVFLMCRTWYAFAQKPLPDPDPNPKPQMPDYDKLKYRIPKQMVTQLFRQYPPRAQVYIAETLESEGFFDSEGWDIPLWFEKMPDRQGDVDRVGTDPKYHSRLAWSESFEAYKEFGRANGLYIPPEKLAEYNKLAEPFRAALKVEPGQMPQSIPPEWRVGAKGESMEAHQRLNNSQYFRRLCNFDAFFDQTEGERDPVTVAMRKQLFYAQRLSKTSVASAVTLEYYDKAWTLYILACLKHRALPR